MRLSRVAVIAVFAACAYGRPNVRTPLGATLSADAPTGAPVPLRKDPTARVILSGAAGLPAASFLPSQAARGADIYAASCGTCHGPGELVGEDFVEAWNNRRVYDLYALVRATMPLDAPGSMKTEEYLDVIAYLLQANKHASAGLDSLRADTLKLRATRIAVGP